MLIYALFIDCCVSPRFRRRLFIKVLPYVSLNYHFVITEDTALLRRTVRQTTTRPGWITLRNPHTHVRTLLYSSAHWRSTFYWVHSTNSTAVHRTFLFRHFTIYLRAYMAHCIPRHNLQALKIWQIGTIPPLRLERWTLLSLRFPRVDCNFGWSLKISAF